MATLDDFLKVAMIGGSVIGGIYGVGVIVEKIRAALPGPRETTVPAPPSPQNELAQALRAHAEATVLLAQGTKQLVDQTFPRLARIEQDMTEQERTLHAVDRNVIRIGERVRARLESSDGQPERTSG